MNMKFIYASQQIDKSPFSRAIEKVLRRMKFFLKAKRLEKSKTSNNKRESLADYT